MTAFDLAALLVLAVSALIGFSRGAVREVVTLIAFTAAAVIAVFLLPFSAPLMRHVVHPAWAGAGAAVIVVFVVAYVAIRVLGAAITTHLHASSFGVLNRGAGAVFGFLRGLVVLAAFALVFNAVTPRDMQPRWIVGGLTWPLARGVGGLMAQVAPHGLRAAGGLGGRMSEGITRGFSAGDEEAAPQDELSAAPPPMEAPQPRAATPERKPRAGASKPSAYGAKERRELSALVDRSR